MKHIVTITLGFLLVLNPWAKAQTYTHPTVGIAGEFVGSCMVAGCSGTYYDNGGAGSNYSNNISSIYRVFCPNAVGQCVSATFTSFNVEQYNAACATGFPFYFGDYLTVGNGPTQNSTLFTTAPATGLGRICGTPATPFSYTANNPSGCLTFRFTSDGSVNRAGWAATLSCVPCATPGNGPNGTDNNDCSRATALCTGSAVPGNATGPGMTGDGCIGSACPAGGENFSNWYSFTVSTSGTLQWTIAPSVATDDYDFAVYGPNVTCAALGSPLRCSDSGVTGNTGANGVAVDNSEDVSGDAWVAQMNVVAGQTYIMVIDEWTPTGAGYTLSWAGTASLNCAVLEQQTFDNFSAAWSQANREVNLNWTTLFQNTQSQYYEVQRSSNGIQFETIERVNSIHGTAVSQFYTAKDVRPNLNGENYYRIRHVDATGHEEFSNIEIVLIYNETAATEGYYAVTPNPTRSSVNVEFNIGDDAPVQLILLDQSGKILQSETLYAREGLNMVEVGLGNFPAGSYHLQLKAGDKIMHKMILKAD